VLIDTATIDFGPTTKLNEHASSPEILDVAQITRPQNTKEKFVEFANGAPRTVTGVLNSSRRLQGPSRFTINSFKCIQHPMLKKQVCGADASGNFNRG